MQIALVTAAAAAFATTAAGCSFFSDDEITVYCVDEDDRVVDEYLCDDDPDGRYHIWHSSGRHHYPRGSVVSGGQKIRSGDADARAAIGLPRTGSFASGTIARGGIGKGSSGGSSGG